MEKGTNQKVPAPEMLRKGAENVPGTVSKLFANRKDSGPTGAQHHD